MYIKQVIIEGFKSYKDQLAVEPFSNQINVVGALFTVYKTSTLVYIPFHWCTRRWHDVPTASGPRIVWVAVGESWFYCLGFSMILFVLHISFYKILLLFTNSCLHLSWLSFVYLFTVFTFLVPWCYCSGCKWFWQI